MPRSTLLAEPDLSCGGVVLTGEEGLSRLSRRLERREETDWNGGGTAVISADVVAFVICPQA